MKKNDWLLLSSVALYSYLFYNQSAGINFLIFTILLLLISVFRTGKASRKNISWRVTAIASLVTAVNVVWVNSGIAIVANLVSLILLAGFSRVPQASLFVAAANSLYSLGTSAFLSTFKRTALPLDQQHKPAFYLGGFGTNSLFIITGPIIIFFIFFFLYQSASPAFSHVISFINFDFISWGWVFFTLVGFWFIFGFFYQLYFLKLTQIDLAKSNLLQRIKQVKPFKFFGLRNEFKSSYFMLILLNILLFLFILSDSYYLTIGTLPTNMPYSEYLHQGVNTLIFSILLAIAILLYVFRGNLNFMSQNKTLKLLAYTWLFLNLILALLTAFKNTVYIQDFGLTYKRIGVFTYLLLTSVGLITSYIKIAGVRNNWFLFRKNAWGFYLVLVLLTCFNWDIILTEYNLTYAKSPDLNYLNTLSDSNIPAVFANASSRQSVFNEKQKQDIEQRLTLFFKNQESQDWQSWNYSDWNIKRSLQ